MGTNHRNMTSCILQIVFETLLYNHHGNYFLYAVFLDITSDIAFVAMIDTAAPAAVVYRRKFQVCRYRWWWHLAMKKPAGYQPSN